MEKQEFRSPEPALPFSALLATLTLLLIMTPPRAATPEGREVDRLFLAHPQHLQLSHCKHYAVNSAVL